MDLSKLKEEDYYKLLEVSKNASEEDIKKAYKKLSLVYHPDRNHNQKDDAETIFKKINEAKNVLLDENQRRIYDQVGKEGLKNSGQSSQNNPFDIFANIFGGGNSFFNPFNMNMGNNRKQQIQRQIFQEFIDLEDVHKGYKHNKKIKITNDCKTCDGVGKKDVQICKVCRGRGMRMVTNQIGPNIVSQTMGTCNDCNGKGKIGLGDPCDLCKGSKKSEIIVEIPIQFPPAVTEHDAFIFKIEDIEFIFQPKIRDHSIFQRQENDLLFEKEIDLKEALCGVKMNLKLLDNREIIIKTKDDQVINPYDTFKIKNLGINNQGDLIIKFKIKFPNSLNKEQRENLSKILISDKEAIDETEKEIYYI